MQKFLSPRLSCGMNGRWMLASKCAAVEPKSMAFKRYTRTQHSAQIDEESINYFPMCKNSRADGLRGNLNKIKA